MVLTKIFFAIGSSGNCHNLPLYNIRYPLQLTGYHNFWLCWFIVFFFFIRSVSYAQTDTVTLQEIEVLGLKSAHDNNSASPVQILTVQKLQSLPSTSVADAIKNFSGVVIKDFGGIGGLKTVMIRSLGATHTGIYIDGIPGNDIATGQADLGRLSLKDISKISLSIGQSDAGLRTGRMYSTASMIEINTVTPDFNGKNVLFQTSLRVGSFGTFNPAFASHFKINRSITTVRINHFMADGRFPYEYWNGSNLLKQKRTNSDVSITGASIKSNYTFKDSSSLKLKATFTNSDRGLPGAIIIYNPFSGQRLQNKDFATAITYENNEESALRFMTKAGYSNMTTIYSDPHWQNHNGLLKNEYRQSEIYLSEVILIPLSTSFNTSIATDLIYNRLKTNAYSINNPNRITSLTAASLKYNNKKTELQGNVLLTYALDKINGDQSLSSTSREMRLSPELSLIHSLLSDHSLKIRVLYKDIFRLPTFNELYYTLSGNLELKPENVTMFNVGVIYEKPINELTGIHIKGDAFINLVTDKIVTVPTMNLFIWRTQNIEKSTIKGLETFLAFSRKISKAWSFELSGTYTYQDAQNLSDPQDENYGDQLAYIPFETAGGLLSITCNNLVLGINTLYNGYRYISNNNTHENLLSSWITTDVTAGWNFLVKQKEFSFKIEVANLFNQNYEVMKGFPMMGRAFFINLDLNL